MKFQIYEDHYPPPSSHPTQHIRQLEDRQLQKWLQDQLPLQRKFIFMNLKALKAVNFTQHYKPSVMFVIMV